MKPGVWVWFVLTALAGCVTAQSPPAARPKAPSFVETSIGFRDQESLREHYSKHGREFGNVTRDEYLLMAQTLRDTPPDGRQVLVAYRPDGVVSKFSTRSGGFIAYNRDKVIRTYFRPNDGIRYFNRQKGRR